MSQQPKWFTKVGWAYVPDTVPGCLILGLFAGLFFVFLFITQLWKDVLSDGWLDAVRLGGFLVMLAVLLRVASRHS